MDAAEFTDGKEKEGGNNQGSHSWRRCKVLGMGRSGMTKMDVRHVEVALGWRRKGRDELCTHGNLEPGISCLAMELTTRGLGVLATSQGSCGAWRRSSGVRVLPHGLWSMAGCLWQVHDAEDVHRSSLAWVVCRRWRAGDVVDYMEAALRRWLRGWGWVPGLDAGGHAQGAMGSGGCLRPRKKGRKFGLRKVRQGKKRSEKKGRWWWVRPRLGMGRAALVVWFMAAKCRTEVATAALDYKEEGSALGKKQRK